jgi:hypothetical protein
VIEVAETYWKSDCSREINQAGFICQRQPRSRSIVNRCDRHSERSLIDKLFNDRWCSHGLYLVPIKRRTIVQSDQLKRLFFLVSMLPLERLKSSQPENLDSVGDRLPWEV